MNKNRTKSTQNNLVKAFKILWSGLKWKMIRGLLSRPILLIPTIWSTMESVLYSQLNFDESPSGRGVANAFRHAVWNLLIAYHCEKFTSSGEAISWAKFTTDLHEECFPNENFDRMMDLHNNQIGREIYEKLKSQGVHSKKEMIQFLMNKTDYAVGLNNEMDFEKYPEELVYFQKD